jgi:hypothetical protein
MKILKIALLLITFIFSISCHGNKPSIKVEDKKSQENGRYDLIRMERRGGGDKLFNLSPSTSKDTLIADVFRYNFRDTSATCFIVNNAERDSAFSVYHKILEGEITVLEDSDSGNNMLVGTWSHYYAVKDTTMTEIMDKEVKDILSQFEGMLDEALSK